MMDDLDQFIDSMIINKSVFIFDDAYWNEEEERFRGGFLWNSVALSPQNLSLFASLSHQKLVPWLSDLDLVIALSSSGITWGTSLAMELKKDLYVLRLSPHTYGPWNPKIEDFSGRNAIIVDNFLGTGETAERAILLLKEKNISVSDIVVLERFYTQELSKINCRLHALFVTIEKLKRLCERKYFVGLDREIIDMIIAKPYDHMLDASWVIKMKEALLEEGRH